MRASLADGGSAYVIDSGWDMTSTAKNHVRPDRDAGVAERKLNDGSEYRIVKIFHEPDALARAAARARASRRASCTRRATSSTARWSVSHELDDVRRELAPARHAARRDQLRQPGARAEGRGDAASRAASRPTSRASSRGGSRCRSRS